MRRAPSSRSAATLRSVAWRLGSPFRLAIVGLIRLYRVTLGGWLGGQCRFYPTCSHYAEEAVLTHGVLRGTLMATWRLARCGPFSRGGVDRVPAGRRTAGERA